MNKEVKINPGKILKTINQSAIHKIYFIDSNGAPLDNKIIDNAITISAKKDLSLTERNILFINLGIYLKMRDDKNYKYDITCSLKQLIELATSLWKKLVFHYPPEEQIKIEMLNDNELEEYLANRNLPIAG